MRVTLGILGLVTLVAACGGASPPIRDPGLSPSGRPWPSPYAGTAQPGAPPAWGPAVSPAAATGEPAAANPRIVSQSKRLQCVPYARELSGIQIRGDAWTWWNQAAGRYERSPRPAVGAVVVFKQTSRNRYGHLAVVTRIVNSREIIVTHANWLNKGEIHIDTPVFDVSAKNDWSAVRVWYTPKNILGINVYPVNGFILPSRQQATR